MGEDESDLGPGGVGPLARGLPRRLAEGDTEAIIRLCARELTSRGGGGNISYGYTRDIYSPMGYISAPKED